MRGKNPYSYLCFSVSSLGAGGLQLTQMVQSGRPRAVFALRQVGLAHIVCVKCKSNVKI